MKTSHFVTPRTLSECQFTVGCSDPIVEPSQWVGSTYSSYQDYQQTLTTVVYGVSAVFVIIVVFGTLFTRFL